MYTILLAFNYYFRSKKTTMFIDEHPPQPHNSRGNRRLAATEAKPTSKLRKPTPFPTPEKFPWLVNYFNTYHELYMENNRLAKEIEDQKALVSSENGEPRSIKDQSCQTDTAESEEEADIIMLENEANQTTLENEATLNENAERSPNNEVFAESEKEATDNENDESIPTNEVFVESEKEATDKENDGSSPTNEVFAEDSDSVPTSPAKENTSTKKGKKKKKVRTGQTKEKTPTTKGTKKYVCKKCKYQAAKKSHLDIHMREYCKLRDVNNQILFACPICKNKKTYNRLMMHLRQYTIAKHKARKEHGLYTLQQHQKLLEKLIKIGQTGGAAWATFAKKTCK